MVLFYHNTFSVYLTVLAPTRYVSVIWFIFHVFQILWIIFTQWSICSISKSMIKHHQNLDWKSGLRWHSYGHWKCMFVESFINWMHRSLQLCSLLSVEYLINPKDIVQSLLNMCLYGVCFLIPTKSHTNQIWVSD